MKKRVSVVLPAYNEQKYIARTLESIKNQDYPEPFEIIVCDNASTDNTAKIAKSFNAKVTKESKKGTRFAYDKAIKLAKGDIIAVTNADVVLPRNWLSTLVSYYKDPKIVAVGTHVKFFNAPFYVNILWAILVILGNILIKLNLMGGVKERTFWGASMSCTKKAYKEVGGFNHGVDTNEDMIFTLLLRKIGKAPYIYDPVVLLDGRRYNKGLTNILKNWWVGIGLNSLSISFTNKAIRKKFKDIR